MRSLFERVVLCTGAILAAACDGTPSGPIATASVSQTLGVVSDIASVVDRGLTGNYHYFEIYASVANGFPTNLANHGYIAFAECNGESYASNATFPPTVCPAPQATAGCQAPQAIIQYQPPAPGGGQINVGILETNPCPGSAFDPFIAWPSSGTQCWFRLEYSELGTRADASITAEFGPVGAVDVDRTTSFSISSVVDHGISNAREFLTLTGSFPDPTSLPYVTCDGLPLPLTLESAVLATQIDLSISAPTGPSSCEFQVANQQIVSNTFHLHLGSTTNLPPGIGAYYWGGNYQPPGNITATLPGAVEKIREAGFSDTVRITLNPGMYNEETDFPHIDVNQLRAQCPTTSPFLPCVVRQPALQSAFAEIPQGGTVVFTVLDSTSLPYFLDVNQLNQNQAAVAAEYENMTLALYQTQQGTQHRFIIANWESDNQMYCGSVNCYVYNNCSAPCGFSGTWRDWCQSKGGGPAGVAGITRWLQLRKQGIQQGIADATALGLTASSTPPAANAPSVYDAVEFATYHIAHDNGFASGLYDVIPAVKPAFASYSAWESANRGTLDDDLAQIKGLLPAGTQLMIGELGYPFGDWQFAETVKAAYRAKLPATILWWSFGYGGNPGLLQQDGSETPTLRAMRSAVNSYAASAPSSSLAVIAGAVDRGIDASNPPIRSFELYGTFPSAGAPYHVTVTCQTALALTSQPDLVPEYQSTGQINVGFSAQPYTSLNWCTFQVKGTSSAYWSPEFGPRSVCNLPTCKSSADCAGQPCNGGVCAFTNPLGPAPYCSGQ